MTYPTGSAAHFYFTRQQHEHHTDHKLLSQRSVIIMLCFVPFLHFSFTLQSSTSTSRQSITWGRASLTHHRRAEEVCCSCTGQTPWSQSPARWNGVAGLAPPPTCPRSRSPDLSPACSAQQVIVTHCPLSLMASTIPHHVCYVTSTAHSAQQVIVTHCLLSLMASTIPHHIIMHPLHTELKHCTIYVQSMVYRAKTLYCLCSIHGVRSLNILSFMFNPLCTEPKHPIIYVKSIVYRAKISYHLC